MLKSLFVFFKQRLGLARSNPECRRQWVWKMDGWMFFKLHNILKFYDGIMIRDVQRCSGAKVSGIFQKDLGSDCHHLIGWKHINVKVNSMINLKYLVKVYFKQGHFHIGRTESQFVFCFHIEFGEDCDQRTHVNEIMSMTIFETFILEAPAWQTIKWPWLLWKCTCTMRHPWHMRYMLQCNAAWKMIRWGFGIYWDV